MVDIKRLRETIKSQNLRNEDVYNSIGMTKKMWYDCCKRQSFGSDYMNRIIAFLNLTVEEAVSIFFPCSQGNN